MDSKLLVVAGVILAVLYGARRGLPATVPARRGRGRRRGGGVHGLGATETVHSHETGRALVLAEKAAHDAQEAVLTDDCEAGFTSIVRARTALATAHAHAASLDRPAGALREASETGRVVLLAEREFRRGCVAAERRLRAVV